MGWIVLLGSILEPYLWGIAAQALFCVSLCKTKSSVMRYSQISHRSTPWKWMWEMQTWPWRSSIFLKKSGSENVELDWFLCSQQQPQKEQKYYSVLCASRRDANRVWKNIRKNRKLISIAYKLLADGTKPPLEENFWHFRREKSHSICTIYGVTPP